MMVVGFVCKVEFLEKILQLISCGQSGKNFSRVLNFKIFQVLEQLVKYNFLDDAQACWQGVAYREHGVKTIFRLANSVGFVEVYRLYHHGNLRGPPAQMPPLPPLNSIRPYSGTINHWFP